MSDRPAMPDNDRAQKAAWVERVLGMTIAAFGPAADASGLASAVAEPSTKLQSALLSAAQRIKVPEDDDALQDNLAALAPAFLAAAMDEPEMSSSPLGPGAAVPDLDRMADIAGLLDALGRKLGQWDAALDEAEAAKSSLADATPDTGPDDATRDDYDENRNKGQSLMAEVQALFDKIREQCRTFENAGGAT